MATTNGNGVVTEGIESTIALEARQRQESVQYADYARGEGVFHFMFPAMWGEYGRNLATLPELVPAYNRTAFYQARDVTLLSTPKYEAMWAAAVGIAVTKAAAWGWEIESSVPLRRKRAHSILLNSTAGVFTGWVHFISAHLRSFMLTGKAVVEIERETKAYGSRIRALHHLDPLRCRFTDDPMIPIEYVDRKGNIHELKYWQVMLFADNLDPTEGEYALVESAAERAYQRIKLMAGISQYLYEKVTGKRVLAIEFIPGLSAKQLETALQGAEANRAAKGNMIYMGTMLVPLPTDSPINRVTIPLAEVPDGFDPQQLRDDSTIIYAGATGQDVNDLDPRLAARQALGSGAQSVVLAEKAKGKGLSAWRQQWTHNLNTLVLDDTNTTFAWAEGSLDDDKRKADISKVRVDTVGAMLDKQLITPEQGRNLLVDAEELPQEFLEEDVTMGTAVQDDDKAAERQDVEENSAQTPQAQGQQPPAKEDDKPLEESDTQKERRKPLDVARLLRQEREAAVELAEGLGATTETTKHLGGSHDQKRHAWRYGGGDSGSARRSMTATPDKSSREEYKKRARQRAGLPERPVRTPGKRGERTTDNPTESKRDKVLRQAREARERIETIDKEADLAPLQKKVENGFAEQKELIDKWQSIGDMNHPDAVAIERRAMERADQLNSDIEDLKKLRGTKDQRIREALYVDDPASVDIEYKSKFDKNDPRQRAIQDGVSEFEKMIDRSVVPAGGTAEFVKAGRGRASAKDNEVRVTTSTGTATVVHEMGHWLEHNSPVVKTAAFKFLEDRTEGEESRWLGRLTGNKYYGGREVAKPDRFINAYMGKQYIRGGYYGTRYATEIISMGLEMFYSNPVQLARQDPEYFDFIYAIVRGIQP